MGEAAISFGAFERTGNPTLVARNCYAESVDSAAGPRLQLRARPGLASFVTLTDGPIRGANQKAGLFSSSALILADTTIYEVTAASAVTAYSGAIAGDGLVDADIGQDADLNSVARYATGTALYKVQANVATAEDFPTAGGAGASTVCFHRGYWLAAEAGTQKAYVLNPGDTVWGALDFASAEYGPDPLVAIRSRGDQVAFLGSATTEVWALTGDAAAPIAPYGGLNEDFGCRARASAVSCDGTLLFVDSKCNVRRWDGGEFRDVSAPGLAKLIASVSAMELVAWYFAFPGHRFYVLRLGSVATWVYDLEGDGERWTTFDSDGYDFWRAQLGCNIGDLVLACDAITADVYTLDEDRRTDVDDPFAVEGCAVIPAADVPQPIANLVMICDLGDAPLEGEGSEPTIQLKISRDSGKTFGGWKERPMGATGHYGVYPRWNGLGTLPAFMDGIIRFRVSDPIGRIFKAMKANV